jgi:hypothetical protein
MAGNNLQQTLEELTVFIEGKRRVYEQYPDPKLKKVLDIACDERDKILTQLVGRGLNDKAKTI